MSTTLCKVTTCYDTTLSSSRPRYPTMKIDQHSNWLSADVQARIEPPPIPLIKVGIEEERASYMINVKIRRNPATAMSETYNMNVSTFEDGQPEEFFTLLENFRIAIDGTGTTSASGKITTYV